MHYQKISIYLVIALTVAGLMGLTQPVLAAKPLTPESSLRVTPVIITINLSPGTTQTQEIILENLSDSPSPIRANFTDFASTGEDGDYTFPETKTNPLLSWTKISPEELIIPPHSKQKVTLTISLPKTIPLGGYFGMLFFEPVPQPTSDTTQIVSRIGVLLLGNLGVQDTNAQKANIQTFTLPLFQEISTTPYLLRVQNTSLNHITAKPIILIKPFGGITQRQIGEDKLIFPGKIRRWEADLKLPNHLFGWYTITMNVSTGNGQQVSEQRVVLVAPFKKISIALIVLVVVIFSIRYRVRLRKSITILFRG